MKGARIAAGPFCVRNTTSHRAWHGMTFVFTADFRSEPGSHASASVKVAGTDSGYTQAESVPLISCRACHTNQGQGCEDR